MRRSLVVLVVMTVLLALVGLPTATAKNPGPEQFVVDEFHAEFGPFPDFSCTDGVPGEPGEGDFDALVSGEFNVVHTHQPVGNGDVVKHQSWVWGVDTWTNSEDESKYATGKFNTSDVGHLLGDEGEEQGTIRVHGTFWHVVAPGYGPVIREAGILTVELDPFSETFKGVDDLHFDIPETFERLCAALS